MIFYPRRIINIPQTFDMSWIRCIKAHPVSRFVYLESDMYWKFILFHSSALILEKLYSLIVTFKENAGYLIRLFLI